MNFRSAASVSVVPARLAVIVLCVSACLVMAADTGAGNWIDVPYVAQAKDGCGAAAISMVLQYWDGQAGAGRAVAHSDPGASGRVSAESSDVAGASAAATSAAAAVDARKIQELLFVPAEKGIPARAMIGYFEQAGYRTFAFRGEWSDIERHVSQGRPLIVSLKASGPRGPLHYAVAAGVDAQGNFVFLNDPARGKMLRMSREGFLREWNPANNWTLLAVPASGD